MSTHFQKGSRTILKNGACLVLSNFFVVVFALHSHAQFQTPGYSMPFHDLSQSPTMPQAQAAQQLYQPTQQYQQQQTYLTDQSQPLVSGSEQQQTTAQYQGGVPIRPRKEYQVTSQQQLNQQQQNQYDPISIAQGPSNQQYYPNSQQQYTQQPRVQQPMTQTSPVQPPYQGQGQIPQQSFAQHPSPQPQMQQQYAQQFNSQQQYPQAPPQYQQSQQQYQQPYQSQQYQPQYQQTGQQIQPQIQQQYQSQPAQQPPQQQYYAQAVPQQHEYQQNGTQQDGYAVAPTQQPYASPSPEPGIAPQQPISQQTMGMTSANVKPEHPLLPVVNWAREERKRVASIKDYTAVLVKQENINGTVQEAATMEIKVRNQPFSVYLKFVEPKGSAGQEVLYVDGKNDGKMWAHAVGLKGMLGTQSLRPTDKLAMSGNKYPITEIGLVKLVDQLITAGESDVQVDDGCTVAYYENAQVGDRLCACVEVTHPKQMSGGSYDGGKFRYHIARIFIDNELRLPIMYSSYDWPKAPGEAPVLIEAYRYKDLKINVGLTENDFDTKNKNYKF